MEDILRKDTYIPGQCNIGPEEIQKRMRIGYIGTGLMILFVIAAEVYNFPQAWKLGIFAPSVYAMSGFIQARQKFCFLFGFFGLFSTSGKRFRIYDVTQLKKDRAMALRIFSQVFLASSIVTLVYYFLS